MDDVFAFLLIMLVVGVLAVAYLIYKTPGNGDHKK